MKTQLPNITFINKIRLMVGSYFLNREMRIRERTIVSTGIERSRNIGMIFNARDEQTFKLIREFAQELRAGGLRTVTGLGFVPQKEVAAFLGSSEDFDFFSKEDFNWYFKPQGRKVVGFMSQPFDMLLDLRLTNSVPLLFITGLSRATFKVGRFGVGFKDYYDLMIDVSSKQELAYLIQQIKHYLKMIDQ